LGEELTSKKKKKSPVSAKSIICFISMLFAVFTENSSHAGSYPSDTMRVLWQLLLTNLVLSALFNTESHLTYTKAFTRKNDAVKVCTGNLNSEKI